MPAMNDLYAAATYDQSATADNATATVTLAATPGCRHAVHKIVATFSAAPAAAAKVITLTWTEGGTAKTFVTNWLMASNLTVTIDLPFAVRGDAGKVVTCTLTASGTGGVLGRVGLAHSYV